MAALLTIATYQMTYAQDRLPRLNSIAHVTINVSDVGKAAAWYTSALEFTARPRSDPLYIVLERGPITLVLNQATTPGSHPDAETQPGIYHVAFAVDAADFSAAVATLRNRGITVQMESHDNDQNAYFQDSEGNWLELTALKPLDAK